RAGAGGGHSGEATGPQRRCRACRDILLRPGQWLRDRTDALCLRRSKRWHSRHLGYTSQEDGMNRIILGFTIVIAVLSVAAPTRAEDHPMYGVELEGFDYPQDGDRSRFRSQDGDVSMAYMDVKPQTANGRTAVLLHGRNFCAATWEKTIAVLNKAGFHVIAPDQIGFCKSTKPLGYQFSIQQLATNTNALLTSLGVSRPIVIGHSLGGMTVMRYALMFPDAVEQMILVNPIGLEDWQAAGVPFIDLDKGFEIEKATTFDSIKQYE